MIDKTQSSATKAMCSHERFVVDMHPNRIQDGSDPAKVTWQARINVVCEQCGIPFRFIGDKAGLSFDGTQFFAEMAPCAGHKVFGAPADASSPITPRMKPAAAPTWPA